MSQDFQPNAERPIYEAADFDWSSPIGLMVREAGCTWDPETESYATPATGVSVFGVPKDIVSGSGDVGKLMTAKLKASLKSPWMIQSTIGFDANRKKFGGTVVCINCGQEHEKYTSDSWQSPRCQVCTIVHKASK